MADTSRIPMIDHSPITSRYASSDLLGSLSAARTDRCRETDGAPADNGAKPAHTHEAKAGALWLFVCRSLMFIAFLWPYAATALDGGSAPQEPHVRSYARPFVDAIATVGVSGLGYRLPLYSEQGGDGRYVLHPPPIFLVAQESSSKLRNDIDVTRNDGTLLTLYYMQYSSIDEQVRKLASDELRRLPPRSSSTFESAYYIQTMPVEKHYFKSAKPTTIKSDPVETSTHFLERDTPIPIYFKFDSEEDARGFLRRLHTGEDYLTFHYEFRGVADAVCEAKYDAGSNSTTNSLQKIAGKGREGFVSRDHASEIVRAFTEQVNIESRCKSDATSKMLLDTVLTRLESTVQPYSIPDWEELESLSLLNKGDFVADLETRAKSIEKENFRNQVDDAFTKSGARGGNFTFASFFGTAAEIFGLGSGEVEKGASTGIGFQKTESEASRTFRDLVRETGILVEKDGEKYIPKSLDVYSMADLQRMANSSFTIDLKTIVERPGTGRIALTQGSWSNPTERVSPMVRADHVLKLDELIARVRQLEGKLGGPDTNGEVTLEGEEMILRTDGYIKAYSEDLAIEANDEVEVSAEDSIEVSAEDYIWVGSDEIVAKGESSLLLESNDGLYIEAKGEVIVRAGEGVTINNKELTRFMWCVAKLSEPPGKKDVGYFPLGLNEWDFGWIAGFNPYCRSDDEGLSLHRSLRTGQWYLDIRRLICDAEVQVAFAKGYGVPRVGWGLEDIGRGKERLSGTKKCH